jgi:hypothetical protein
MPPPSIKSLACTSTCPALRSPLQHLDCEPLPHATPPRAPAPQCLAMTCNGSQQQHPTHAHAVPPRPSTLVSPPMAVHPSIRPLRPTLCRFASVMVTAHSFPCASHILIGRRVTSSHAGFQWRRHGWNSRLPLRSPPERPLAHPVQEHHTHAASNCAHAGPLLPPAVATPAIAHISRWCRSRSHAHPCRGAGAWHHPRCARMWRPSLTGDPSLPLRCHECFG